MKEEINSVEKVIDLIQREAKKMGKTPSKIDRHKGIIEFDFSKEVKND